MSETLAKGLVIDGFEILETINDSEHGTVYKVKPGMLKRVYALKISKPGYDDKIINERMALETIGRQPNVAELFFAGKDSSNNPYIVEDYVESNLAELLAIKSRNTLDHADAVSITKQILTGLSYAHDKNIVHRDLKPANILIDKKPNYYRVRLCDFGLATVKRSEPVLESSMDDNTSSAGTLRYLSPEQKENGTVTKKTDIYAVGLILYEMLTGKLPHINYPKASQAHYPTKGSISEMRAKWGWVDDIIHKALQPKPSDRYASTAEMLKAISDGETPPKPEEPKGPGFIERACAKIESGLKTAGRGAKVVLHHTIRLPIYALLLPFYLGLGISRFLEDKFRYTHDEIGFFSALALGISYYFVLPTYIGEDYLKYHLTQTPTNGTIVAFHPDRSDQGNKHFSLIDASKLPEISKIKVAAPDATGGKALYALSDDGKFFYYTTSNSLVEVNIKGKQRKTLAKSEILGRFSRIIHQNDKIYAILDTEVWSVSGKDGLKQHSDDLDSLKLTERSLDRGPYQLDKRDGGFTKIGLEFQFKAWYLVGNFILDEEAEVFSWLDTSAPFNK